MKILNDFNLLERHRMNRLFSNEINERIELLIKTLEKTKSRIKCLPQGRVNIKRRGASTYYYFVGDDRKEKLIKRGDRLAEDLLQKSYLTDVYKAAEKELKVLIKYKDEYPLVLIEDVYDQLTEERKKLVKPIIPTDEQLVSRWLAEPYKKKPISEDVPIFETKRGERVRSKSEMIIANMLYDYGIPYKYECPINVGGEIIHPDFTILRLSDRRIIYYEHCGRMGDPGYVEDMIDRSRKYTFAGIYQGDKLFYTFESAKQPLDVRVVSEMIEKNFR